MNERRKYFIILAIAALIGLLGAIWLVFFQEEPTIKHIEDPYLHYLSNKDYVFGTGTVTPSSDEIPISSHMERKITSVSVKEGDKVKKGEVLVKLFNQDLVAELEVRKTGLKRAEMELDKLTALPRKEDLLVEEATVNQAKVAYEEAERQRQLAADLFQQGAISEGEWKEKNYLAGLEKARFDVSKAQLDKLSAGAWSHDKELASLEIEHQKRLIHEELERIKETIITSPIDGTILKVNVHAGEVARISDKPLMILGNIDRCHVEVAVDENDVSYIQPNENAVGFFREKSARPISLSFIRIQPLMVQKSNLSGSTNERVDTRVLMVVYQFGEDEKCAYIGQQMDVFIPRAAKKNPKHE